MSIEKPAGKPAVLICIAAGILSFAALTAWADDRDRDDNDDARRAPTKIVPLKDARLKIELNSTDQDVGVQVFIDADPWKTMEIFDPRGKLVFRANNEGRLAKQGGTELFLESGEPNFSDVPLAEFLRRFPQGDYRIIGRGLEGEKFIGTAKFTHNMPAGPVLTYPTEDSVVDPHNTVVMWQQVPAANGNQHGGAAWVPVTRFSVRMGGSGTRTGRPSDLVRWHFRTP